MSIADKILRAKTDYDEVYDAGYEAGKAEGGGTMDSFFEKMDSISYFFSSNANADLLDYILSKNLTGIRCQYVFIDNTTVTDVSIIGTPRSIQGLFQRCTSIVNAQIDTSTLSAISDVFNGCTSLKNAGTIDFSRVSYTTRTFQNCSALEEIRITGNINVDVDFGDCKKLSFESLMSIRWALSPTAVGKKLTVSQEAIDTAFADNPLGWYQVEYDRPNWSFVYK